MRRPSRSLARSRPNFPKVNDTFQPLNLKVDTAQPARPREPVKTGLMTGGSSAVPTITKPTPVEKVQTGGFGDPNGVAGPSDPNKRANVGQFGNPALPPGPGYGNGSGGANGAARNYRQHRIRQWSGDPPGGRREEGRSGANRRILQLK